MNARRKGVMKVSSNVSAVVCTPARSEKVARAKREGGPSKEGINIGHMETEV
jgi:hypothetical protein